MPVPTYHDSSNVAKIVWVLVLLSSLDIDSVTCSHDKTIPKKFIGSFKVDRDDHFDEYLAYQGVNWFVRKLITFSSHTIVLNTSANADNEYDVKNIATTRTVEYKNVKLGETFEGDGMDGKKHEITFDFDKNSDTLVEKHVRPTSSGPKHEEYRYKFANNGELVMSMSYGDKVAKRFFKRVED